MKGHGLLAGMIIGMLVLASLATASDISIFETEPRARVHKFGVQVTGAGAMFSMDDINNYFLTPGTDNTQLSVTDAQFGIGGGLALLYRSHDRFRWGIGFNFLGKDSFEGSFSDTDGNSFTNEHAVSGSEFYIEGSYLIPFGDALHMFMNIGVNLVNAKVDRITPQGSGYGPAIYDASGSALGARVGVGAEFTFTENFGLVGALGFRLANVGSLTYEDMNGTLDENGNPPVEDYVWDAGNNTSRKIAADFTGVYGELGLRYYFDAATGWYHP